MALEGIREWRKKLKDPNLSEKDREIYNLWIEFHRKKSPEELEQARLSQELASQDRRREAKKMKAERQMEQEIIANNNREAFNRRNTYTLNITWNDISFGKDKFLIQSPDPSRTIEPITHQGVITSLKDIKNDYFIRLYGNKVYKLTFFEKKLVVKQSPAWTSILETIQTAKEYYDFKYSDLLNIPFILKSKLSNQEILELYKESIDKIPYLKYLASIHHEDFKIIPIRELNNGKSEEGFLFRIRSNNGNVLIIWENVNEARATFVFKSNEDYLDDDLAAIESYIVDSNLKNKRLFFHILDPATAPIKLKMKFVKSIDHRRIEDYQKDIEKLIQER